MTLPKSTQGKGFYKHSAVHSFNAKLPKGSKGVSPLSDLIGKIQKNEENRAQHVLGQFKELKGDRIIGSIESPLNPKDSTTVQKTLESSGYETKLHKDGRGQTIEVMYFKKDKPEAKKALKMYEQYNKSAYSITPEQHYELGKYFGIPERKRLWFRKQIESMSK